MKYKKATFIVGAMMVGVVFSGCRKQPVEQTEPTPEEVSQEETNKFLNEQGIKLPEGAQRAYLSGGLGNRGVVTKETGNKTFTYNLVASLPELTAGVYQGFISDGTSYKSLGLLREDKGGYVADKTISSAGLENFNQVMVSKGASTASPSADVVLTGQFGQ